MGKEDYKNEKKGHGFLCVPKELLFDNRYKQLTIEAILLYSFFLRKRIENVDAEASSMFIAYNLKRLFAVFSTQELIAKFR